MPGVEVPGVQNGLEPRLTIRVSGEGYEGFVVIDSLVGGRSSGGVRIASDLAVQEVGELAREMTLKYSFFGMRRGGAKAGLRIADEVPPEARLRILHDFGGKLAPLIRNGIFNPGMDLNCGPAELGALYRGAGIDVGDPTDTSYYTALGVAQAIFAGVAALGQTANRALTVAIEGLGRVGMHLAQRLPQEHYRIVSVATLCGAVRRDEGYSVEMLAEARRRSGDALVNELPGERISREDLFTQEVDVLLPASRTGVLTAEIATGVRARLIIPIANAAYGPASVRVLHEKGILALPGYVANVGGVLGSSLHDSGVPESDIETVFATGYARAVGALVETSRKLGIPPCEVAERYVREQIAAGAPETGASLATSIYRRFLRRRLPARLRGRAALRSCRASLQHLANDLSALASRS